MSVEAIYSKDLDKYVEDRRALIIDLRSAEEYQKSHIKGAYNMPYEVSTEKFMRLSKNRTYILYCERGITSFKAAREMGKMGYQVKSLINGINMYKGKYLVKKENIY